MEEEGFRKVRERRASEIATQIMAAITQLLIVDDRPKSHARTCALRLSDLVELCELTLHIKCNLTLSYDSFDCVWHKSGTRFNEREMIVSDAAQNIHDGDTISISVQPAVFRREKFVGAFAVKTSDILSKAVVLASKKRMPGPVEAEYKLESFKEGLGNHLIQIDPCCSFSPKSSGNISKKSSTNQS